MATYQTVDGLVVARPEDLLYLQIALQDGVLRLEFPPQHVMEYPAEAPAPPDTVPLAEWPVLPAVSSAGGTTYLVFSFDTASAAQLGDHLLEMVERSDCSDGRVEVVTTLPMKPYGPSHWRLDPGLRTGDGWTAVWQARLLETSGTIAAVDGPLLQVVEDQPLGVEAGAYDVLPFVTFPQLRGALFGTELTLSMLGASGRIRGPHWPEGVTDPGTVTSYDHKTQFGRDQQWTEVVRGHLSSGHPAELQVVTTRVFAQRRTTPERWPGMPPPTPSRETYYGARLYSTATLTVIDPVAQPDGTTPFRSLRITPDRLKVDLGRSSAFWVTRAGMDVLFSLVATDWDGRKIPFTVPLMFIIDGVDHTGAEVTATFNAGGPERAARRQIDLGGQAVTLADPGNHPGVAVADVTLPVHRVSLTLGRTIVPETVAVALDAVGRLSGRSAPVACSFLADGIVQTGDFLKIVDPAFQHPIAIAADKVGALASPSALLGSVNAKNGVIPTPGVAVSEAFGSARLLGVPLAGLLAGVQDAPPILRSVAQADAVVTGYEWRPALNTDPAGDDKPIRLNPGATLVLKATVTQPLGVPPAPPTSLAEGWLTHVTLSLLGLIDVTFGELHFLDAPDATPTVSATGVEVKFKGDLAFVSGLAKKIGDFEKGSPVTVDSNGIAAGYTVAFPSVAFGVFSLTNVTLGARVLIPFTDEASVRFNFAERHAPFGLSVGIFGGGGFLAITATTAAIERVEGSLEFGGVFEVDVGVASGGVFAKGGVSLLRTDDIVTVDGYLRCGGHLEILEVVGVSLEFEMVLGYRSDPGDVHGRATLTVGVHVLLFNESVSFSVERSFSTSSDDEDAPPPAGLTEADWTTYGAAFA